MTARIVVVGGGVTGLAAGHEQSAGRTPADFEVFESLIDPSLGGINAGAAFRGLGLPACVRQGRAAARAALAFAAS